MKHLLAVLAVVALVASPALAHDVKPEMTPADLMKVYVEQYKSEMELMPVFTGKGEVEAFKRVFEPNDAIAHFDGLVLLVDKTMGVALLIPTYQGRVLLHVHEDGTIKVPGIFIDSPQMFAAMQEAVRAELRSHI